MRRRAESIGKQVVLRSAGFLDRIERTMMIGDDQAAVRDKRSRASVHAANPINQTDVIRIEQLIGRQLDALVSQIQTRQFAHRKHAVLRDNRRHTHKTHKQSCNRKLKTGHARTR